jgi:hypothetical protein
LKITTLRTTAGSCPDVSTCPSVDLIDKHPDRVYLIANVETDPAVLAQFKGRIGAGEILTWQPAELHPDIQP